MSMCMNPGIGEREPRWHTRTVGLAAMIGLLGSIPMQMGCGHRSDDRIASSAGSGPRAAAVRGAVVSVVNGLPITISDVQTLVSASALSPRDALRRLQAERLLMVEAERRGLDQRMDVSLVARQSSVQALLRTEAEEVRISESELQTAYADGIARFDRPEARASVHVLAKLPAKASPEAEAAAKAFAESMLAPLAEAPDLDHLVLSQNGQKTDLFDVVAERLPAVNRSASFAPQFLEAIFAVSEPGVVKGPVRTQFGWHAIAVTEIVPREVTSFATASVTLRHEMTAARREQRIKELIAGLRLQNRVVVPDNVGETLDLMPL